MKHLWEMTREEFFNDPDRVWAAIVERGPAKFKVSYMYVNPSPAGPFRGSEVTTAKPAKGSVIPAMFGAAKVTSVSRVKSLPLPDNGVLFESGKAIHRAAVEAAVAAGETVSAAVLADYPELVRLS